MTYPWSLELKPCYSQKVIKGTDSNDFITILVLKLLLIRNNLIGQGHGRTLPPPVDTHTHRHTHTHTHRNTETHTQAERDSRTHDNLLTNDPEKVDKKEREILRCRILDGRNC